MPSCVYIFTYVALTLSHFLYIPIHACTHANPINHTPTHTQIIHTQVGKCVNVPGSFYCKCLDGFKSLPATIKPDHELYCEDDDNECERDGCARVLNSTCTNTYGSFTCTCALGYVLNQQGTACVDMDECATKRNNCARGTSTCINTEASFECQCNEGFLTPEEIDQMGNCSATYVENLLFKEDKDGAVRIIFPRKGAGTVCMEIDECMAHMCANASQECILSNRTADVCDSVKWFVANTSSDNVTADDEDVRRMLQAAAAQQQQQGHLLGDVAFTTYDGDQQQQQQQRRALLAANSSNSSLNGTNGTNQTGAVAVLTTPVPRREEGLLVRSRLCAEHSQCYNSIGSFQVCLCVCVCVYACMYMCVWRACLCAVACVRNIRSVITR
jgi:hypothetical protein